MKKFLCRLLVVICFILLPALQQAETREIHLVTRIIFDAKHDTSVMKEIEQYAQEGTRHIFEQEGVQDIETVLQDVEYVDSE